MRRIALPVACLIGLLATTAPAQAYIDPAAGSLLLQALIAGVAGALLTIKLFWRRLTGWFGSRKSEPPEPGAEEPEP